VTGEEKRDVMRRTNNAAEEATMGPVAVVRRLVILVAVLGALSLVAACGGDGGDSSGSGDGGSSGGVTDGQGGGAPVQGGTVVYGLEAENDQGWCLPEVALPMSGIQVARTIYDTLTAPNEDGEFVPFLAKSVTPNATFDSWDIELREGVKFHDGTDLTAEVVKNNLDAFRGLYPGRTALIASFVLGNIASVEVTGALSVRVTTKTPWQALPSVLYYSGRAGVMAQAQLDNAESCDRELIGTGPFKLVEWRQNERLTTVRNEDYWQTDADGNQLPYLDAIEYRPVIEGPSRVNSLLAGELQAMHTSGGEQIEELRIATEEGTVNSFESDEFAEVAFGVLNTSTPPFDNKDARLALITAINRDALNDASNLGVTTVSNGPFAPGNTGYLEDSGFPDYDPAVARGHLAAYEAATGRTLSFTYAVANDAASVATAQLMQQMLDDVGIEMELRPVPQSELIDLAISADYEAMYFRLYPGGDPDDNYIFWTEGSPANFGRVQDDELTALMQQGRVSTDDAERTRIYEDVNRRFASEGYSLWKWWTLWDIGTAPSVYGILGPDLPDGGGKPFPGLAGGHPVTSMWIDQ
jgi:peptide/nickel transport system substrate-binding protein